MGGLVDRILDPNDFTYRYNTTLTPDEELAFTQWAKENNKLNDAYDYGVDFITSRITPAIVSDTAKISDDYVRDTNRSAINRMLSKLPVLSETLEKQYSTTSGTAIKTDNPLATLLMGGRTKKAETNFVLNEVNRLAKLGNKVTLSDPVKSMDLTDELKPSARRAFAQEFSSLARDLIQKNRYKMKTDERKAELINDARKKAIKRVKKQYNID